jgi:hypothetical protein
LFSWSLEPRARVELATCRLRIGCSTTELPRPLIINDLFPCLRDFHQTFIVLSRFRRRVAHLPTEMPDLFGAMLCCTGRRSQHFRLRHTPSFPRVHNGIRSRTRCKKDSKMILALSDSFRKLLSLQVLASSMALNCL